MENNVKLGSSDLKAALIGFGTMHFGVTIGLNEAKALLDDEY